MYLLLFGIGVDPRQHEVLPQPGVQDVVLIQPSHRRKRKCSGDPAHIRLDLGRPTSAAQLQQWVSESFSRGGGMARLGGCRPPRDSQCLFAFGGFTFEPHGGRIQNFGFADVSPVVLL